MALFAGVAPIEAPRYVTVVVIDEPSGDHMVVAQRPPVVEITREVLQRHAMPTEAYAGQDEGRSPMAVPSLTLDALPRISLRPSPLSSQLSLLLMLC